MLIFSLGLFLGYLNFYFIYTLLFILILIFKMCKRIVNV